MDTGILRKRGNAYGVLILRQRVGDHDSVGGDPRSSERLLGVEFSETTSFRLS